MEKLKSGVKAPDFSLPDQDGKIVNLSDFKGKKLLIYFYPKADTPGCTTQACSIRDNSTALDKFQIARIGISPDEPSKQKKFETKFNLNFPLLCDTDHKVSEAYSVWVEKNLFGKKAMGILRSSFLVDENGIILEAWYKVSPDDTVPNVISKVKK